FSRPREYMSDRSDYDSILHLIEEKEDGEKLFIFNVTMQNHGGFEVEGLESTVHVTELNGEACEGQYPKADQYLTLIQMSDEALEYFLAELEQVEEPTMVVMFGDHQPSVETHLFEALYGMRWTEVPDELKLNSFKTPYMIWTNYDREAEDAGDMSAFMLGNEVLKAAGVEPTGLFAAAESLRENYDAVHAMGVLEKDGTFTDSRKTDVFNDFSDIRKFHTIQYYEIFE
ncbi:MAG: sulfatase-like hydrolase/transferase, partial [Lachnospiraceae bacterium]|nr:sulfatase-like hydrolase/transferase [Lachnospiraceae bacterium]